ncbi:unnamed protein product [Symbiodinium pilosum]|uniref:Uncharacterized protein n=1 Tax=Symbiodinium pilosum TaxID=2952 RepID=A0A812XF96_SYMPI|nr:unnamed protein product [Symbiodinium pilosum]
MQRFRHFHGRRNGRKDTATFHPSIITAVSSSSSDQDALSEDSDWSDGESDAFCCYISLASAREADSVLGLGLFAHRRTRRQVRYGLPHDMSFSLDYVDVAAFNAGLEAMKDRGREPALVSSSRGQLNAWLPLYVDSKHWARAREYVESAVMTLSGAHRDEAFPETALSVCCSLLTQAAVSLSLGHSRVTERAVQMYGDAHRLLLQLACEWPELQMAASHRLRLFLHHPESRLRQATHSLGDLLHCLLIVDDLEWEELKTTIIPEALRRHVWRQECKGFYFDSASLDRTASGVLAQWENFAPDACKVLCFIATYLCRVGRPQGASLQTVMAAFDRNQGRLPKAHEEIAAVCSSLQEASLPAVLDLMGASYSEDFLAEMVLWAVRHGSSQWRGWRREAKELMEEGMEGPDDLCPLLYRLQRGKPLKPSRGHTPKYVWKPKQPEMGFPDWELTPYGHLAAYSHLELQVLCSWLALYGSGGYLSEWPAWWYYSW